MLDKYFINASPRNSNEPPITQNNKQIITSSSIFQKIVVKSNFIIMFRGPRINDKPIKPVTIKKEPNPFRTIKPMILLSFTCDDKTSLTFIFFIFFQYLLKIFYNN